MMHDIIEMQWTEIHQRIHRESWQDELERKNRIIQYLQGELEDQEQHLHDLQQDVELYRTLWLSKQEEREAEITRLRFLLDAQSKPPRHSQPHI